MAGEHLGQRGRGLQVHKVELTPPCPPRMQVPVFIWAPEEEGQFQPGRYCRWWYKQSVTLFARLLAQLGSRLVIRRSTETRKALQQVVQETGARAVYFNHLYDPISIVRRVHEYECCTQKYKYV